MNETAYPLSWPNGWKRAKYPCRAAFKRDRRQLTVADGISRLEAELERLIGRTEMERAIISTNLQPTLRGVPRSGQAEPTDKGAAVYFTFNKRRTVLACDKWDRVADNIASIAAHIECLRGIERYGVGTLEQAFRGYQALEDFTAGVPWRRVLGFKDDELITLETATTRYRSQMMRVHPDMTGEHGLQAAQLNDAIAQARKELTPQ